MIFMLTRTLLWCAAILVVALVFYWLRGADGGVMVELNQRAYGPFSPMEFVGLVLFLGLLIWLAIKLFGLCVALVRFLAGDETALSRFWSRSRERRGFDALSGGLSALAEGDAATALTRARKAERLLDRPDLSRLLIAQAAEASGNANMAREYYKQLASDPNTAYAGVKGLLKQALANDEKERALKLAAHAFELKPKDPELLGQLFELQCDAEDWEGARKTLAGMTRAKTITRDVADRRDAVLLISEARAAGKAGDSAKARDLAKQALKKSPALIPAVIAVAKDQAADGSPRRAAKTLAAAWRTTPHPDLAGAFAALEPEEDAAARRRRFATLTGGSADAPESRMLTAELALADRDWGAARKAMGDLAEEEPSARAFSIMAAIEKGEGGDDDLVRGLLARAVSAPRGAQWTCATCGGRQADWTATCNRCDAFDSLDWKTADEEPDAAVAAAAMLPVMTRHEPAAGDAPGDAAAVAENAARAPA